MSSRRTQLRIQQNLGIVPGEVANGSVKRARSGQLDLLINYYNNTQYKHLIDWDAAQKQENYIPVRDRQPRIKFPFAKILTARVTSKLIGGSTFPQVKVEDDPDMDDLARLIVTSGRLKSKLIEPTRHLLNEGAVFVRFAIVDGIFKVEHYLSNYCYPVFDPLGNLESLRIRYVFEDKLDFGDDGKPKRKWFQMDLSKSTDIAYDTPEYIPGSEPKFQAIDEVKHDMGFVQGEWFRTSEESDDPEGFSITEDILDYIDAFNYSISQSDQAIGYNQDPQLLIRKLDEEEINNLIKSSEKAWNLGREGEAELLESSLTGADAAGENRKETLRLGVQDATRIVMLDPEKAAGHAQSAKAMEVLHGPLVELINEIRPQFEHNYLSLVQKMALAALIMNEQGGFRAINIPTGFKPKSFNFSVSWPPIFPLTMDDLQKKVGVVSSATNASLISRETGLRFIAKDFGVEDIEEEIRKVNEQPVFNPFGMF